MITLQVQHKTTYRYRRPVEVGVHRLMLRPRDGHDLRLISSELACEPRALLSWSHDVFGNSLAHASFSEPTKVLTVTSRIVVEQYSPNWPVFSIATFALHFPFSYSPDERIDLGALLTPQYRDPDGRLRTWAEGFVLGERTDTLSLLKDLNIGVSSWVQYQARDEEGTQNPLDTLDRGWGTCRDFAVLFVEAARRLGFGGRVVSGYLYNPDATSQGSIGSGSTHAWGEIYLPGAGWIAFDPTNQSLGGANLIRVAVARDISQIVPISGAFIGAPEDFLGMEVSVEVNSI
jgi:transglutaminase-like putative cysteine protease